MVFNRMLSNIKHSSNATLKAWCYQCESILAQRSRRLQQLFTFYHRVYGSHGLKLLIRSYHRQLPQFKGTNLVLSAVGVVGCLTGNGSGSGFDWNTERLSLANFDTCHRDVEFINTIHRNKLCERCKEYNMKYCYCLVGNKEGNQKHNGKKTLNGTTHLYMERNGVDGAAGKGSAMIDSESERNWEPYFSKDHFHIWRREERTAMYSYKVYASFNDISAADLLHVQVDLDYRKQWDDTAVALHLIEEDPIPGTNSHLIYWEMQWPKFFNNRDYVYCRRFICDDKRKVMMVANRGTQHPKYPHVSGKVRVTDYWSFMVIKPYRNFQEPGVHYILTYYDDPGLPIPQSIKSWVAQKQMPDILQKMYFATKNYSYKKALAMKDVFSSFSMLNNEYAANKSRDSWLQRFWRPRSDENLKKGE
ncbi:stAR-related lipid transfer protein 7, mitochondrial [Lucilia sericata]|uniref:stAR-related lipid transfer protein 7, mitochondrial n=1 Tax=Lucilia sericata TaxID=13632 RepID=UPI0018A876D0|nr:stAR-related lipid transfer protein 7, mitochondrial [Lucilia sericata]XP_037806184.1 stAR-related lipid transfer protein 7, mitochondrial [Lucilia sericata]